MSFLLILAILFLGIAAVALVIRKYDTNLTDKKAERIFALVFLIGACLALFFASATRVSTKNVGIVTTFGATSGELGDGLHFVWPWQKVTEMDAAIQTDNHVGAKCIDVRIANQQTACVPVSIRWRIVPSQADELFRDYRSFEHVRDSLVTRYLTAAVNNQLRNYNPLNSISIGTPAQGASPNPSLATIADGITKQMQQQIGTQISVLNTLIPIIRFDSATQGRLNQLQQQIALTRIAEQAQKTAVAQALANKKLAGSVNNSPNVLVANCLDILNTMVKQGQAVPPGFSCWPGGNLAGIIAGGSK